MAFDTLQITRPKRRLTVAIGLFDGPLAVQSAMRDLGNHGFDASRIQLVAGSSAGEYDRLTQTATMRGGAAARMHRIGPAALSGANACLEELVRQLTAASPNRSEGDVELAIEETFAGLGLERQANTLVQHLLGGGGILIVRVESAEEQRAVCSMLLHYASRGVQSHQLRYTRSGCEQPAFSPT